MNDRRTDRYACVACRGTGRIPGAPPLAGQPPPRSGQPLSPPAQRSPTVAALANVDPRVAWARRLSFTPGLVYQHVDGTLWIACSVGKVAVVLYGLNGVNAGQPYNMNDAKLGEMFTASRTFQTTDLRPRGVEL